MIWNRRKIAVLDILALAKEPMTVVEIAEQLLRRYDIDLHDDRVRKIVIDLWNEEPRALIEKDGTRGRSTLWEITANGRKELEVMAP